jgi:signal transduction histidine kinase/sugar lactone lactonase YvrE
MGSVVSPIVLVLLLSTSTLQVQASAATSTAEPPVLARLTFEIHDGQEAAFAELYETTLLPGLIEAGLRESPRPGRTPVEGYVAHLFEFDSIADFGSSRDALWILFQQASTEDQATYNSLVANTEFDLYEAPLPEPQILAAGVGEHHWRSFDADDGLLHSSLAGGVWQADDGTIWVGDDNGQWSHFDGRRWQAADMCGVSGPVTFVRQDSEGSIWCIRHGPWETGTPADLIRFDGQRATTIADSVVIPWRAVEDHEGVLWFGTRKGGLFRWDLSTDRDLPPPEGWPQPEAETGDRAAIRPLLVDHTGRVWASVWSEDLGDRLMSHDSGETQTYPRAHEGIPDAWFKGAVEDREGRIWFGASRGLWVFADGEFESDQKAVYGHGRGLLIDDRDDVWFRGGTNWHAGVTRWESGDRHRGQLTVFTTLQGLAGNSTNDIMEDTEGGIWVATNAGASRMEPNLTTFRTTDGLFSNEPNLLALDREGRLFYTARDDGFGLFDGDKFIHYAGFDGSYPLTIDSRGDLWLGSRDGGNSWVQLQQDRLVYYGLADGISEGSQTARIVEDREGALWLNDENLKRLDFPNIRQDSLHVWRLAPRQDGGLWLSLNSGGKSGGFYQYTDGDTLRLDTNGELDGANVWNIFEDRSGDVWIGAYGQGAVHYDGEHFTTYGVEDGLVSPMLLTSFQDSRGHMWFGTDGGGAIHYDGTAFQALTIDDGLAGNVVRSIIEDGEGNIWFACSGGLTRYTPPPPSHPPVFVDAIVADRRYEYAETASLPSSAELIAFEFHGMSMKTRPGAMVYRYRLTGHHDDWRQTREERVEYGGLPSGDYTFEVIAVDRDLGYSESPATLRLRVHPPYGEVILGVSLIVALILVGFQTRRVVRRDRRLIATNAQLEAANEQITEATQNKSQFLRRMSHDLRSPMNAIIGYSRLLRRRTADRLDEREQRNLENIETSSGNLLNLINDILDLSRIEAGHVEMNLQPVDVRVLADECADALESIVQDDVTLIRDLADVGQISSDPDRLRQVVMNLLGNATKFTDSGSITLSLKRVMDGKPSAGTSSAQPIDIDPATGSSPHSIELTITDTGIGIPREDLPHIFDEFRQVERQGGEAAEGTGLGLAIAKKTVDLLDGQISATSEVGVGTTFLVRLGS